MTATAPGPRGASRWIGGWDMAACVLVFVALGPLIGGLVLVVSAVATTAFQETSGQTGGLARELLSLSFWKLVLPLSYVAGGLQAFVTGLTVAVSARRDRPLPLATALIPALLGSILFFLFMSGMLAPSALGYGVLFAAAHLIPAAACWRLTRRWHSPGYLGRQDRPSA